MKKILTSLALIILIASVLPFSLKADVEKDLKYIKGNLPHLLESNNAGTLFYISFIPCWEETGPNNAMRIYISSAVATKVTLEIPGLGLVREQTTIPNDVIQFVLAPQEALPYSKGNGGLPIPPQPEKIWEGRAVILKSDAPIIAYGVTRYQYTSDGYLAYPITSLGKTYQVASYADPTDNRFQFLPSYTSIAAVYDNTKVTFRLGGCESCRVPKEDGDTLKTGEVIRRTLNSGDVWLIPGIGPFNDLTGSKITASKPISVVSGNFCAYIPTDIAACDFIIEQELPENVWGSRYHVTPMFGRQRYGIIKVFAKKPYTQVNFNGVPTLNIITPGGIAQQGYFEYRAGVDVDKSPKPVVVSSNPNNPINVVQYNPGQQDDNVPSDPFQLQLSPTEQYQKEIVFNTPGIKGGFGFFVNYINIVYKATPNGTIPDDFQFAEVRDGSFNWVQLNSYSSNPGTKFVFDSADADGRYYYSKTIKLPYDGVYRLKSNEPFVAYAYGFGDYDSYGFPTSVATADLETPDTLAPYVEYTKDCDGFVAGQVIDEPRIDPANRSNLGLIYMETKSYNYKFQIDDFIVGETPSTNWTLKVVDPTIDAKAYLVFIDRKGNRTDTLIEHYAISPEILEYSADYGTFKLQNPALTKSMTFTLTNQGTRDIEDKYSIYVTLDSKEIEDKSSDIRTYQNFDIVGVDNVNLAPLKVGQEIKFDVVFNAREEGYFRDSVGVIVVDNSTKDTCFFHYFALLEAFVGNQYIIADDYNFPATVVGTRTNEVTLQIKNPLEKPYIATTPLKVTGYTVTGDKVGKNQIFEVKGLENISEANPLFIDPGKAYQFTVSFSPDAVRNDFAANITFIADSKIPDNVTKLTGIGVQPGLLANGEDWGKKRVDPNSYKVEPGPYQFTPYPSPNKAITIKNDGSSDVTLKEPVVVNNLDNKGAAFLVELNGKNVPLITNLYAVFNNIKLGPGEERTFNVFFHPTVDGQHELELQFISDAPVTVNSVLRGYGIYPKDSTNDYDFGKFVVGTPKKTGSVRFYNTNWTSEDNMTITDFRTEVDANTTFGVFGSNNIFRWDRNNIQDENGNVVNFPISLAPGHYITVNGEYEPKVAGNYSARLITVSDAQEEAVSHWTGSAIEVGIAMDPAQAITCQKQGITLNPVIRNTGSVDMELTNLSVVTSGTVPGFVPSDFTIQVAPGTILKTGETLTIPVVFNPSNIYLPNSVIILKVNSAGTGANNVITRVDSTNLTVTATFDQFTSKAKIEINSQNNNGKVVAGTADGVKYTVIMNRKNIATSFSKDLKVSIMYKLDYLGLAYNDQARTNPKITVSSAMQSLGYSIANFNRKIDKANNSEILTINLVGNSSVASQSGDIDILTVNFDVFLPFYRDDQGQIQLKDKKTEISHLIGSSDPCFVVEGDKGTVQLDSTCVDDLRPIQISSTKYHLGQVNPNPVNGQGGDINFSVGGTNIPTEIKIYNSDSKLIGVAFSGTLNSGDYSVRIPIEQMSSGVYFYEMVSGPFRETKKMVVQK